MTYYEDAEGDKNENGDGENKFESKNPEDDERKVGPGAPRNTEEPQGTHRCSCTFLQLKSRTNGR